MRFKKSLLVAVCLMAVSWSKAAWCGNELFPPPDSSVLRSVVFQRLSDGKIIYQQNADTPLSPASTTKLITSAVALCKFSPSHQFKTEFSYTGKRSGGIISGDLIVKGGGDPLLTNEKLWQLAADLRHLGISEIRGNILVDNSLYPDSTHDDSRLSGKKRSSHAYDAPISAFAANFNTFAIAIAPSPLINHSPMVELDPYDIPNLTIVNNLKTVASGIKGLPSVSRLSPEKGAAKLVLSGAVAMDSKIRKIYRSANDPVWASGEQLKSFLEHERISVMGTILPWESSRKVASIPLYTLEGYDLDYIIRGLNRFSTNFTADMLVKNLGVTFGKNGSMEEGVRVIEQFLAQEVGLSPLPTLINGSGLDHNNRMSARQLAAILRYMHNRIDVFPEFFASLPLASRDGTMERRFHRNGTEDVAQRVRGKTGTLSQPISVASIAGYLYHPAHGLTSFVIIENGILGKAQPDLAALRQSQDRSITKFIKEF
jgi:D-alanyl-D-alanine carboxypeptidase/D-alanyl-D-alanine-endopeptidase (penicillin-binding protein 4)